MGIAGFPQANFGKNLLAVSIEFQWSTVGVADIRGPKAAEKRKPPWKDAGRRGSQ